MMNYPDIYAETLKQDWKGLSAMDAFRPGLPFYYRDHANRLFYQLCTVKMETSAHFVDPSFTELRVKPQVVFAYLRDIPHTFRLAGNLGLSIFCVADEHRKQRLNLSDITQRVTDPDKVALMKLIEDPLDKWILSEHLCTSDDLRNDVINYRYVSASLVSPLEQVTAADVIKTAFFYSELLPFDRVLNSRQKIHLYDLAVQIKQKIKSYRDEGDLDQNIHITRNLMCEWLDSSEADLFFDIPDLNADGKGTPGNGHESSGLAPSKGEVLVQHSLNPNLSFSDVEVDLPMIGINQEKAHENATQILDQNQVEEMLKAVMEATETYDDLTNTLKGKVDPFKATQFEGEVIPGQEIKMTIGGTIYSGFVNESLTPICQDLVEIERLIGRSTPLVDKMKKLVFKRQTPSGTRKLSQSGSGFHKNRMILYPVSNIIYSKRKIMLRMTVSRVLVILILDASGSMRSALEITKIFSISLTEVVRGLNCEFIAAAYGDVGSDIKVNYLSNRNMHNSNHDETIARIAGSKIMSEQSDSLCLASILHHASLRHHHLPLFVLHLTDEGFGKSTHAPCSAQDEVIDVYRQCREQWFANAHFTLVSFRGSGTTGLQEYVDEVIHFPRVATEDNINTSAERLGEYVTHLIKDFQRM